MFYKKSITSICFLFLMIGIAIPLFSFEKVVIWGHKLHTHTHSYIHYGFYKTFKHLGYNVHWFDDNDSVANFDFSKTLFLTEGQVDKNIPLRSDCIYILHNCHDPKYLPLANLERVVYLQVYTDNVLRSESTQIEPFIFYNWKDRAIYMPWATDLLPHEIEENKKKISESRIKNNLKRRKIIHWVGTVGGGLYGNINELTPFSNACSANRVSVIYHDPWSRPVSMEENARLIQESYMAPAIVGTWQKQMGYIPCRIFKNISYGKMGITNSLRVYELFNKKIIYNPDTFQLFYDAQTRTETMSKEELFELMDFVKEKHTYINRIQTIITFLSEIGLN